MEGEIWRVTVSDAKRLKSLDDENAKLKKLLAEQMLDAAAMKELLSKNGKIRRDARSSWTSAGQAWPFGEAGLEGRLQRNKPTFGA